MPHLVAVGAAQRARPWPTLAPRCRPAAPAAARGTPPSPAPPLLPMMAAAGSDHPARIDVLFRCNLPLSVFRQLQVRKSNVLSCRMCKGNLLHPAYPSIHSQAAPGAGFGCRGGPRPGAGCRGRSPRCAAPAARPQTPPGACASLPSSCAPAAGVIVGVI